MRVKLFILILFSNLALGNDFITVCLNDFNNKVENSTIKALEAVLLELEDYHPDPKKTCATIKEKLDSKTSLDLRGLNITDLRPLSGLKKLQILVLADNEIENLWLLSDLPKLTILDLQNNQIKDIGSLPFIPNLSWVNLKNNHIENILPIKDCYNLSHVFLDKNPALSKKNQMEAQEIKGLINQLIWFRQKSGFNYSMDFEDTDEMITVFNNRAARGDLQFFRQLSMTSNSGVLYADEIFNQLDKKTQKIMIGSIMGEELSVMFEIKLMEALKQSLSFNTDIRKNSPKTIEYINELYEYTEAIHLKIRLIIEYYIMHEDSIVFSLSDKTYIEQLLDKHISSFKRSVSMGANPIVAYKAFSSPYVFSMMLKKGGDRLKGKPIFTMKAGLGTNNFVD